MLLTNPFLYRKTLRLEATSRAVTVTPGTARLLHHRRIKAHPATATIAPSAAAMSRTRVILAQTAAISLAGTATLKRQRLLKCLPTTVSLTTSEAILQRTRLAGFIKAEITIEPQPARLLRNLVLKCEPASIELTPNSANFLKVMGSIEALPQAITIDGRTADLRASRLLAAAPAGIVVTPQPAQLVRTYPLLAQPGAVVVTPRPAVLRLSRVLKAVKQDIAISPKAADLIYTPLVDPYFANVVALLHFDGTDGSTTFTDSSPLAATYTAVGNAQIDTAQSKFGGSSLLCDNNGDYVQGPSSASYGFPSGTDFTVEAWVRLAGTPVYEYVLAGSGSNALAFLLDGSNLYLARQSIGDDIARSFVPALNTWYHVAGSRSGTTYRLFVNGTQLGATATTTVSYVTTAPRVGGNTGVDSFNGWVDDFRLTRGVARYTANFTPPTRAFPNQ